MKTFICEICGDAYLGEEKTKNCRFCGARAAFIKEGKNAQPIVNIKVQLSNQTINNLNETLKLDMSASAIYTCMAEKATTNEIIKMYKRQYRRPLQILGASKFKNQALTSL